MAVVPVADSDTLEVNETDEDLNGDTTSPTSTELFTVTELEDVSVVGGFTYHPPFQVTIVPMVYTASFGGNQGYEEPTTRLHLTAGTEYPQINATLYDVTDEPLSLTTISGVTIDLIRFDVAYEDGTFDSLAVTIDDADAGEVSFTWPGDSPIGVHLARFTLYDKQATNVPLLSIPTWPLTIVIREAS